MGKRFFDFMTVLVIFLMSMMLSAIIFSGGEKGNAGSLMLVVVITVLVVIFYTIAIIILGIRKAQKFSHGFTIFFGSIFLPGFLPVVYYLSYLRARMGKPPIEEQFKELVEQLKQDPEKLRALTQ